MKFFSGIQNWIKKGYITTCKTFALKEKIHFARLNMCRVNFNISVHYTKYAMYLRTPFQQTINDRWSMLCSMCKFYQPHFSLRHIIALTWQLQFWYIRNKKAYCTYGTSYQQQWLGDFFFFFFAKQDEWSGLAWIP